MYTQYMDNTALYTRVKVYEHINTWSMHMHMYIHVLHKYVMDQLVELVSHMHVQYTYIAIKCKNSICNCTFHCSYICAILVYESL